MIYFLAPLFSGEYSSAQALAIVAPLAMLVAVRPLLEETGAEATPAAATDAAVRLGDLGGSVPATRLDRPRGLVHRRGVLLERPGLSRRARGREELGDRRLRRRRRLPEHVVAVGDRHHLQQRAQRLAVAQVLGAGYGAPTSPAAPAASATAATGGGSSAISLQATTRAPGQ